ARSNLNDAESALQHFRTRTITLPSEQAGPSATETRDPIRSNYFDMEADRDQLRRDREAIEGLLPAGGGPLPADALSAIESVPDVRVLDPAVVPQRPVKNTTPRLLLLGLIAGLGLGMVGAVVLDRVDPKVRYPEQVSRDLGLPILGVLPHLRTKEPAEVVEALRGLRLNVIHEYGTAEAAQPLIFTVTSPGPGDGKT